MTAPRSRSLWPREHGAYVQLLAPVGAALLAAPSLPGALLATAAFVAFVAVESLLVASGGRGKRIRDNDGTRAKRRLAVLGTIAALVGSAGLVLAPRATLVASLVVLAPATLAGVLATRRRVHNALGEIAAASALCGVSAIVVVAGGASLIRGALWWLAWGSGYATTVVAVQYVLAAHKRDAPSRVVPLAICGIAAAGLVVGGLFVGALLALASSIVVVRRPAATQLRTVGIALALVSGAGGLALGLAG